MNDAYIWSSVSLSGFVISSVGGLGGELLDRFAGARVSELLQTYTAVYTEYRETTSRLKLLRESASSREQEADFLRFQVEELGKAGVLPGEVARAVEGVHGVGRCHVDLVWDPPWSKENMSEEARLELGML